MHRGEGGTIEGEPPGADRCLGAVQGRQYGGERMWERHQAQIQAAEAGGWQVGARCRFTALCGGIVGRERF